MLSGTATGGYKGTKFHQSAGESELPIVPLISQRQHNFKRWEEQYLHHVSKGVQE